MSIRLFKCDYRIYKYLEIRTRDSIYIMSSCCRGKMPSGRKSHHSYMRDAQILTPTYYPHRLLYIAERHVVMASRHPVLEHTAGESTSIEPILYISSFVSHRKHSISSTRTDKHAITVGITCRIYLKESILVFFTLWICGSVVCESIRSSIRPYLNSFRTWTPESSRLGKKEIR